ncbi:MAG TPA: hypothetical protein DEG17_13795 [Cyanobacteria bacterium UBA11149]|nr:hypothetical protein [Cyanobacteria bacterium UBA11367]HBE58862.1 hypothetical protein [Cyanobacteria bacterium UBA11366]HBK66202.1 hypothetical protein [Cyanobacteria bacterium UBA11166]HBR74711.1 hypothetical protein [Cyanobacteria bacterium UBA11159]HBW89913.1 hypothetical protein [Cyanobacteria bacterium UBA11149]
MRRFRSHCRLSQVFQGLTTDPTKVTPEEIAQYREQFADYPEALAALDEVEACDYILDDAASP